MAVGAGLNFPGLERELNLAKAVPLILLTGYQSTAPHGLAA